MLGDQAIASALLIILSGISSVAAVAGIEAPNDTGAVEVVIKNSAFVPGSLTIRPGDTVRFTNQDAVCHTVTRGTPQADACTSSGSTSETDFDVKLDPNASASITFTTEGNLTAYCKPHAPILLMTITVRKTGPPGPPRFPAVVEWNNSLNFSWSRPESDNGSAITHYRVFMGPKSEGLSFIGNATKTSHNATALQNGVRQYLAVSAVNGDSEGPRSIVVSGIPRPPGLLLGRVDIEPRLKNVTIGHQVQFRASVFDEQSWPVSDATVVWSVTGDIGTIDLDGSFTAAKIGNGAVWANATRSGSQAAKKLDLEVTQPRFDISGIVADFRGSPLDNASVTLFDTDTRAELETLRTVSNGSFLFRAPPGRYYVYATAKGYQGGFSRGIEIVDQGVSGLIVTVTRPGELAPEYTVFLAIAILALIIGGVLYMVILRAGRGRARREGESLEESDLAEERAAAKPVKSSLVVEKKGATRRK